MVRASCNSFLEFSLVSIDFASPSTPPRAGKRPEAIVSRSPPFPTADRNGRRVCEPVDVGQHEDATMANSKLTVSLAKPSSSVNIPNCGSDIWMKFCAASGRAQKRTGSMR